MDITINWKVRRSAVYPAGGNRTGITGWGVHVDGGLSRVVQPHIQACLELMELRAKKLVAGKVSPFFTLVDYPSSETRQAMEAFAELLTLCDIEGQYCDEPGRAMFLQWHTLAKIVDVQPLGGRYRVEVAGIGGRGLGLGQLQPGTASCTEIGRPDDRSLVELRVEAENTDDLSHSLRLIGNVAAIRWDRRDSRTLELLGEPLL